MGEAATAFKRKISNIVNGGVPDYKRLKLGTHFRSLVRVRQEIKAQIDKLEAKLGTSDEPGINQEIELVLAEHDLRSVKVDDLTVTLCEGSNTHLSKERLLEEGVAVKVIEDCTVTKKYTYIQVKEAKAMKEQAEKAIAAGVDLGKPRSAKLKKSVKARSLRKMGKAGKAVAHA